MVNSEALRQNELTKMINFLLRLIETDRANSGKISDFSGTKWNPEKTMDTYGVGE